MECTVFLFFQIWEWNWHEVGAPGSQTKHACEATPKQLYGKWLKSDNERLKREISWLTGWVGRELERINKLYMYMITRPSSFLYGETCTHILIISLLKHLGHGMHCIPVFPNLRMELAQGRCPRITNETCMWSYPCPYPNLAGGRSKDFHFVQDTKL